MDSRGDSGCRALVVLRALNLGDLLVAVPALRALRRGFPAHDLTLVTDGRLRPVVELIGGIDRLYPANGLAPLPSPSDVPDRRDVPDRPDMAVNMHGTGPRSNEVLDALHPHHRIGHGGTTWPGPAWREGIHERQRWCDLLVAHGIPADPADLLLDAPAVASPAPDACVLHVGAGYGAKLWPVERFAEVAAALAGDGHPVVITGSERERPRALAVAAAAGTGATVLAGRTDLAELIALIAGARLVVSGDTGAAHLASAYRTPSVVLFGPVPAAEWGPPADGPHRSLSADPLRRGEPFAATPDPALLAVTTAQVLAAAGQVMARAPAG